MTIIDVLFIIGHWQTMRQYCYLMMIYCYTYIFILVDDDVIPNYLYIIPSFYIVIIIIIYLDCSSYTELFQLLKLMLMIVRC